MVHRAFCSAFLACTLMVAAFAAAAQVPMRVEATARQADGKILVAGQGTSAETPKRIVVGRLNADGSLDTSFVSGGWLTYVTDPGVSEFRVTALAVAPDGKVVVALVRDTFPGLLRLDGYGSIDSTFGTVSPGLVVDNSIPGLRVNALTILANGDILGIGGYTGTYTGNVATPAIVRFTSYGQRDFYFGSGPAGVNLPFWSFNQNEAELRAAANWGNGTFVTAGYMNVGGTHWFLVARFFIGGQFDYSFANGGWSTPVDGDAVGLTVEPGASITAAGHDAHSAFGLPANNFIVAQLDAYGFPGHGLGSGNYSGIVRGHLWIDDVWDASATAISAARIPGSADVLVAGTGIQSSTGRSYFFTSRLDADFIAPYGWAAKASPRTEADDAMTGAYPTPDGQQIVAVGTRDSLSGESALRVRYFADDGTFDTDFPVEGIDGTPNPFGFVAYPNAGPAAPVYSNVVRIAGINVPVSISIANGSYSVGCLGNFTTAPGTIANGQTVCLLATSATTPFTTTNTVLTVGGVDGTFTVTTNGALNTTITQHPLDPSGSSAQFSYASDTSVTGYSYSFECRLDTEAFAACPTASKSYTGLAAATHTFDVRSVNAWGPDPTPASFMWTVLGIPDTFIGSTPAVLSSQAVATFDFTASQPSSTFECKIDAAVFAVCASPKTYAGLAAGAHTFQVRATNAAGTDPTPAAYSWTIDLTPPDTTIISGPSGGQAIGTDWAIFAFTSNDPAAVFQCSLDAGPYAPCTSPVTLSSLANGSHTLAVRAIDTAGNIDSTPAQRAWAVDIAPPETTVTGGPGATSTSPSATFYLGPSSNQIAFDCKLDGVVISYCGSTTNLFGLKDGTHMLQAAAKKVTIDGAGNVMWMVDPTPEVRSWVVDLPPPQTTVYGPGGSVNYTTAQITFSSDNAGASFECSLDGASWSPCSGEVDLANVAEGPHTFLVRARTATKVDPTPAALNWVVDLTAPDTTIASGPAPMTSSTSATFVFSANEAGATFNCGLDSGNLSPCSSPVTYSGLSSGAHTFVAQARDAAGNYDFSPSWWFWTVDIAPPDTTITSGPVGNGQATATFQFTSSESPATFECSLDGAPFAGCSSPFALAGLADGYHSFSVRSSDAAGNVDPTPSKYDWLVDTGPPNTTLISAPATTTAQTSATFTFASSEPSSTFVCSIDNGPFYWDCASPATFTGLAEGAHRFIAYARDAAYNLDPTPIDFSWVVDTVAPETAFTSTPGTLTSASATFAFAANESGATLECRLDAGSWSACTSPVQLSGLASGAHTFEVRATDLAGNVDASPASFAWTADTTAPDTSITSAPSGVVAQRDATISFTSPESNVVFECVLDGGAFAACASPVTYAALSDGPHAFQVRARDAAGNVDPAPASANWTVDTTAPDTTLSAGPSGTVSQSSATFTFASNDGTATFQCKLDAAAWSACTTPASYASLVDGTHVFQVRAIDPSGNVDASPASGTWTIDTAAPNTSIASGPNALTGLTSATLQFSASEGGDSFRCSLDGAAYSTCVSPVNYAGLAEGAHSFSVYAVDGAGNADASPAVWSWRVDVTAPDTSITSGPSARTNQSTASFLFSSSDPTATFECRLDAGVFAACTSPKSYSGLSAGSHTFQARAKDSVGNVDASPAAWTWTVDTTAPDTTITGGPSGNVTATTATFTFTATEAGSTFECKLDNAAYAACATPKTYTGLAKGTHTFTVRAKDPAGNTDASPATRTWKVI